MAISVVTRPEKTLENGYLSTWNSSELPLRYKFENDLHPVNSVDIIEDIQGVVYASDKQGTALTFLFNPATIWSVGSFIQVTNSGTELDGGNYQIKQFDGNFDMIIDVRTEDTSNTGNAQKYYRNYIGLVKVFAGARDGHPYNVDGSKPLEEIGTIEVDFKEESGVNVGYVNVKSFIKPDITADFDYDNENSHHGWTSFHLQTAESYDDVVSQELVNVTTEFVDDEKENCIEFVGFQNPSFIDGDTNWLQESWAGGSNVWNPFLGYLDCTSTLGSNIVYQDVQIYKDVIYNFNVDFDLTLNNNYGVIVIVFGKNDGGSWNDISSSSVVSVNGNNVLSLDVSSNSDYEYIGIAVRGTGGSPDFYVKLNSLQVSTNVVQPCLYFNYALFGCKQFQDELGGNFGDYVLNKVDTITPKMLTHFDELSYFYGKPFYLNGVIPSSVFSQSQDGDNVFLSVEVFDESDNILLSYNYKVDNFGDGVYTVDPELQTQLDINNIASCDWKYSKVGFIIIPANLFIDGDKGTFESGANGFTLLNNGGSYLGEIGTFFTQDSSRARTGLESAFFRTYAPYQLITPTTKGIFPIFENDTALSVVQGLDYEFSAFISVPSGIVGSADHIDNGTIIALPSGYEYEECEVSGFYITENNMYTVDPPTFDQWLEITTKFTAKVTEDLTFSICEKLKENIETVGGSNFSANIDDITFKGPIEYISENKTVKNQCSCSPYGVTLRWKNDLGGWDNWHFDGKAVHSENVTGKVNIKRDITSNWDDTFINGDTQKDTIKTDVDPTILVRSQLLTKNEQLVLQQIRRSVRVQMLMDSGKWQTVIIPQSRFIVNDEGDKTRDISFEIVLPSIITQQQ